jgi:hypothetical protein
VTAVYSGSAAQAASTSNAVAESVSPDVTSLVKVTLGRLRRGSDGRLHRRVVLMNRGTFALPGPVLLVLDGLAAGRLRNRTGVTQVFPPLGSPFILVQTTNLTPGQSATIDLVYNGSGGHLGFTSRVLAGTMLV